MKKNRSEEKDSNDCNMMDALIENNDWKRFVNQFKQSVYYQKTKLKIFIINILKKLGLFEFVRKILKRNK